MRLNLLVSQLRQEVGEGGRNLHTPVGGDPGSYLRVRAADRLPQEGDLLPGVVLDGRQIGAFQQVREEPDELLLLLGRSILPMSGQCQASHLVEVKQPLGDPTDIRPPLTTVIHDNVR